MELYAIYCGRIQQMKEDQDTAHHQEELDFVGAKTLQTNFTIKTT